MTYTHRVPTASFHHLRVGDRVTRMLAGFFPVELTVTGCEHGLIQCGNWEFDPDTGMEIDPLLGWTRESQVTGSYLIPNR